MEKLIKDFIKKCIAPVIKKILKIYNWYFFNMWQKANNIKFLPIETEEGVCFPRAKIDLDKKSTLFREDSPHLYLNMDTIIFPQVLVKQQWDYSTVKTFIDSIVSNDVGLIDIGANVGLFSRQALIASPKIKHAYCFEPNKSNYQLLKKNLEPFGTVDTYNVGISDKDGTVEFFVDTTNSGNLSVNKDAMLDYQYAVEKIDLIHPNSINSPFPEIMQNHQTFVYKSDTQGLDESIFSSFDINFWDKVECALLEIYRLPGKQVDYEKIEEIFNHCFTRIFSLNRKEFIGFDEFREYSKGEDEAYDDFILS